MDKTGEPNAENENAVRLLIENGCRIDLQTDSYQEFFQKFLFSRKLFFLIVKLPCVALMLKPWKDQFMNI